MIAPKNILVLLILVFYIPDPALGQKINSDEASLIASEFLTRSNESFNTENILSMPDLIEITEHNETLAFVFGLKPQGFIVVSAFETNSPLIGFSLLDNLPESENLQQLPAYSIIKGIALAHKNAVPKIKSPVKIKSSMDYDIWGPWVYTLWGQVNCHNNQGQLVNVTNYYTPNNYAVGCVAISLSTLLHYYQWPPMGMGYHEYYDGYGSSTGWYEANFGETNYKWDLMLEKYNNQASTDPQREAAGELTFHTAVALEMDFEYNGSTSNVNDRFLATAG